MCSSKRVLRILILSLLFGGSLCAFTLAGEKTPAFSGSGWVNVTDFAPPGAKTDGTFDWNSEKNPIIQKAINSITNWEAHGPNWAFASGTLVFPAGKFLTSKEIRVPGGIRIVGAGNWGTVIYGKHNGAAVINMKGASRSSLENLQIRAEGTKTALLLSRLYVPNKSHPDGRIPNPGGAHHFLNIRVQGKVTEALVYSIASECSLWTTCAFNLSKDSPGKHVFYTSRRDDLKVDPDIAECVNTVHTFVACNFTNHRKMVRGEADSGADCVYIGSPGTQYLLFLNCYFVAASGAYVRIIVPEGDMFANCRFIECGNEASPYKLSGQFVTGIIIEAPNNNNPTLKDLSLDHAGFAFAARPAVWVKGPMTLVNFKYDMDANSNRGGLRLHSLVNSDINISESSYYASGNYGRVVEIAGDAIGNRFIGPNHQFRIAGKDISNVYIDNTTAGLSGRRRSVLAKTTDYTIPRSLAGLVLSNDGATKPVTFRLPPAEPGLHFTIVKTASPAITVAAAKGNLIGPEPQLVNTTGNKSPAILSLIALNDRQWIVRNRSGAWRATTISKKN